MFKENPTLSWGKLLGKLYRIIQYRFIRWLKRTWKLNRRGHQWFVSLWFLLRCSWSENNRKFNFNTLLLREILLWKTFFLINNSNVNIYRIHRETYYYDLCKFPPLLFHFFKKRTNCFVECKNCENLYIYTVCSQFFFSKAFQWRFWLNGVGYFMYAIMHTYIWNIRSYMCNLHEERNGTGFEKILLSSSILILVFLGYIFICYIIFYVH